MLSSSIFVVSYLLGLCLFLGKSVEKENGLQSEDKNYGVVFRILDICNICTLEWTVRPI